MKPIWFAVVLALLLILLSFSCKKESPEACADPDLLSDCIDPSLIDSLAICATIYEPVCGCDGNTYGNECQAEVAGLKSWKSGPCCE